MSVNKKGIIIMGTQERIHFMKGLINNKEAKILNSVNH